MQNKNLQLAVIITLLTIFIIACKKEPFYSSAVDIPDAGWKGQEAAVFSPEFTDTSRIYNILLSITNTEKYRYSNLWLFIKSKSPDGHFQRDTLEIFLADETGKWFGKKSSNQWNYQFYYRKNIRFPKSGKYTFEIQQGMRDLNIQGISNIAFELEESK